MFPSSFIRASVLLSVLAIICMPFLPAYITRSANYLVRPAANTNRLPVNATRLAGLASTFAFLSSSAISKQEAMSAPKVQKSDSEWMAQLSPQQVSHLTQRSLPLFAIR